MKFLIVILSVIAVALAQQQQQQQQAPIGIVRQSSDVQPDGRYEWSYETENGIAASEQGEPRVQGEEGPAIAATGQFAYTAPDGTPVQLSYTADENGFQPQGSHLPTPPPIPDEILKSIEYNAAHPEENTQ